MSTTGVQIATDGRVTPFTSAGEHATLEEIQAVIGGNIEGVFLPGATFYIDEVGKLNGAHFNETATFAARQLGWRARDILVGPALVLGIPDDEGYDTSLTKRQVDAIHGWAER